MKVKKLVAIGKPKLWFCETNKARVLRCANFLIQHGFLNQYDEVPKLLNRIKKWEQNNKG